MCIYVSQGAQVLTGPVPFRGGPVIRTNGTIGTITNLASQNP